MARYEFLCPTCDERFEESRPMADADAPAICTGGHQAKRLLSMFRMGSSAPSLAGAPAVNSGGGCCGGACGCG